MTQRTSDERAENSQAAPTAEARCVVHGGIEEQINWLRSHQGELKPQLAFEELGGAPTDPEKVRKLPLLQLQMRALEQAGLAFYVSNALADRYEYLSPGFRELFGLSEQDAAELRISDFSVRVFHPDDLAECVRVLRDVVLASTPNSTGSMHLISRFNTPTRGQVWLQLWQTIFFDEKRRPAFSFACFYDITPQKRAEAERDRLMDCIVHDLRNPITILRGYLGILETEAGENLSLAHRQMLRRMLGACEKMSRMTNDIIDFERVIHADLTDELEDVDVFEYLNARANDFEVLAGEKEISLEFECAQHIGIARFSPRMIEQVIENLLTNAVKFSFRGGVVRLSARRDEQDLVQFSVRDSGVGIPPWETNSIFSEFARATPQPTEGESSTGLGLAICRRVVERHGGRIWCESELGVGSTFHFTIGRILPPINDATSTEPQA